MRPSRRPKDFRMPEIRECTVSIELKPEALGSGQCPPHFDPEVVQHFGGDFTNESEREMQVARVAPAHDRAHRAQVFQYRFELATDLRRKRNGDKRPHFKG